MNAWLVPGASIVRPLPSRSWARAPTSSGEARRSPRLLAHIDERPPRGLGVPARTGALSALSGSPTDLAGRRGGRRPSRRRRSGAGLVLAVPPWWNTIWPPISSQSLPSAGASSINARHEASCRPTSGGSRISGTSLTERLSAFRRRSSGGDRPIRADRARPRRAVRSRIARLPTVQ